MLLPSLSVSSNVFAVGVGDDDFAAVQLRHADDARQIEPVAVAVAVRVLRDDAGFAFVIDVMLCDVASGCRAA
jgi:hypothetical protein